MSSLRSVYRFFFVCAVVLTSACGADEAPAAPSTSSVANSPVSLEGVWLLEGTDLFLDITLDTAAVDGRTGCARILGSLTASEDGNPTSFSLPGRDTSGCSTAERREAERAIALLQSVASAIPEPGGYALFDIEGSQVGRLQLGS
ncbi:MAG: hypothetical protein HKN03_16290 [Acidimicrobiales bacterium]|nr:hypothetical protein [Acidimicrobiales bacterium]